MPVYLITLHAYRSWMPDRARGYVRRGKGILPPDAEMARRYEEAAAQEPVVFTPAVQAALVAAARALCAQKRWRLHQVMTDTNPT